MNGTLTPRDSALMRWLLREPSPEPAPQPAPAPASAAAPEPAPQPAPAPGPRARRERKARAPREHKAPPAWPLYFLAIPAAVAIWGGWVGLGGLCGFGPTKLLPGILPHFSINLAITLPMGVEAYGAYAVAAWLWPGAPAGLVTYAKRSALAAFGLGLVGQPAYHLMTAYHIHRAPVLVIIFVSCIPIAAFAFATALTHKIRAANHERQERQERKRAGSPGPAQDRPARTGPARPAANRAAAEPPVPPRTAPPVTRAEPPAAPATGPRTAPPEPRRGTPRAKPPPESAIQAYRASIDRGEPLAVRALAEHPDAGLDGSRRIAARTIEIVTAELVGATPNGHAQ